MNALVLAYAVFVSLPGVDDLIRMQGRWQVTFATDGTVAEKFPNGVPMLIKGNQIISLSKDEKLHGVFVESSNTWAANRFLIERAGKSKIVYFAWHTGIYDVTATRIRFCLKYAGQGVEGEEARRWKPPVDFVVRPGQQHLLITFERLK